MMKINIFRGELTGISAKTEALVIGCFAAKQLVVEQRVPAEARRLWPGPFASHSGSRPDAKRATD